MGFFFPRDGLDFEIKVEAVEGVGSEGLWYFQWGLLL